jgi:hypothetical protein
VWAPRRIAENARNGGRGDGGVGPAGRPAPAIDGAFLLSTRGGDFELRIGQDLSIGYLSHDATSIQLYFQESLTFLVYTSEAAMALTGPRRSAG